MYIIEIHVSNLKSKTLPLDFSFNNNIKWISRHTWNQYLYKIYYEYCSNEFRMNNMQFMDKYAWYVSPLYCDISKTNYKDNGIIEIHAALLSLISEYSSSSNVFREMSLCEKALSNVYIDLATELTTKKSKKVPKRSQDDSDIDSDCEYIDNNSDDKQYSISFKTAARAVRCGQLSMSVRKISTLHVSRGSVDDCSIAQGDWIWCFKRLIGDMDKTYHAVIRIRRVKFWYL